MTEFRAIFQQWTLAACVAVLAVALALAVAAVCGGLVGRLRRLVGRSCVQGALASVAVACAVMYGGGKVSVHWDMGLADDGTIITNDTVTVRWTYSGIPSASSVFVDYRLAGSTNDWYNLGETLVSALVFEATLANATNYDYWVYSTYIPPVPVHTNGVWVGQAYETKARAGAKAFLILNGKIREHGRTIATPAAKRKEQQDDE